MKTEKDFRNYLETLDIKALRVYIQNNFNVIMEYDDKEKLIDYAIKKLMMTGQIKADFSIVMDKLDLLNDKFDKIVDWIKNLDREVKQMGHTVPVKKQNQYAADPPDISEQKPVTETVTSAFPDISSLFEPKKPEKKKLPVTQANDMYPQEFELNGDKYPASIHLPNNDEEINIFRVYKPNTAKEKNQLNFLCKQFDINPELYGGEQLLEVLKHAVAKLVPTTTSSELPDIE
jgi:hypothetical protein